MLLTSSRLIWRSLNAAFPAGRATWSALSSPHVVANNKTFLSLSLYLSLPLPLSLSLFFSLSLLLFLSLSRRTRSLIMLRNLRQATVTPRTRLLPQQSPCVFPTPHTPSLCLTPHPSLASLPFLFSCLPEPCGFVTLATD